MIVLDTPTKKRDLLYGDYFLASEADDDPEDGATEYTPKANTKVIKLRPSAGNRKDFSQFITDDESQAPEEIPDVTPQDASTDPAGQEAPQDDAPQDPNTEPVVSGDDVSNVPEDDPNSPDVDAGEEITGDDTAPADATDADVDAGGENPEDGPDVDGGEEIGVDEPVDAGDAGAEAQPEKKGPGIEYDSTRKYNLFKEYAALAASITNYITKLEENMSDNPTQNQSIKIASDRLHEIYDLCTDYMLINFEVSSYTKSILFYQMLKVAIQQVFKLLSKGNKIAMRVKNNNEY